MPAQCCKDRWKRLLEEDPEMPVFTLLGKDVLAVMTVQYWLDNAKQLGVNTTKIAKVQKHLDALVEYRQDHPDKIQIPD